MNLIKKNNNIYLILILLFTFVTRFYRLGIPATDYFDEVFHAFTARLILQGDPKPWQWWNPLPEGHAYEWSHPPFAKLAMAASMFIFGEHAFAWRLPSALFGSLIILLVYLLALLLFNNRTIGLIAAALCAMDGLLLTMSRIGKDDIYVPFFVLLCLYLFCKNYYFWSSVALGLGIASKWSTFLIIPVLAIAHPVLHKKFTWSYLWFLVIPSMIYFLNYIPMFLTGNPFENFFIMQKTMFNFHKNLTQWIHAYRSMAWSWPFDYRPVYLYWNNIGGDGIATIYALGNPLIFWAGIIAIVMATKDYLKNKNNILGLLLFSYVIFWVPWIFSPREMFLYMYLPSVTFMSIIIAAKLYKFPQFNKCFLWSCLLLFIYFYPHWIGLPISHKLHESYFWFSSWR